MSQVSDLDLDLDAGASPAAPACSVLLVSLAGFRERDARQLTLLLDDCSALGARWKIARDAAPDLWIVDGANARSLGRGLIEVTGAREPLRFRPADMPHPVAFAEPLDASISTSHRFDPHSMHSLNVLLTNLGRWLVPRLVQQALVQQLVANGASFTRDNVIEVQHLGRTLALVDFAGDTAVASNATPADVRRADWVLRERGEAFAPPGFRIARTEQVLWQFAQRSERADLLPGRYSRLPIHLRRVPALPPRELSDRQLRVVRELAYAPRTLSELADRTGATEQALRRDLGALYLVGAITCDPGRSRAAREQRRAAELAAGDELSIVGAAPLQVGELTAPGFARGG